MDNIALSVFNPMSIIIKHNLKKSGFAITSLKYDRILSTTKQAAAFLCSETVLSHRQEAK